MIFEEDNKEVESHYSHNQSDLAIIKPMSFIGESNKKSEESRKSYNSSKSGDRSHLKSKSSDFKLGL